MDWWDDGSLLREQLRSPALEVMAGGVQRHQDSSVMRSDGREQQTCLQRSQAGFPPRAESNVVRVGGPMILWQQGQKLIPKFPSPSVSVPSAA